MKNEILNKFQKTQFLDLVFRIKYNSSLYSNVFYKFSYFFYNEKSTSFTLLIIFSYNFIHEEFFIMIIILLYKSLKYIREI